MIYHRKGDLVMRKIADESILVPVAANVGNLESVFTMSPVGSFIWELLDGDRDGHEIARRVSAEYEVDDDTAGTDVGEFLTSLETAGLVERVETESSRAG